MDTRPAFEGHLADYIKSDHVHPTPAGAQVISDLLWKAMQGPLHRAVTPDFGIAQ